MCSTRESETDNLFETESEEVVQCSVEDVDNEIATIFPTFSEKITFKPVLMSCAAALFCAYSYLDMNMQEK